MDFHFKDVWTPVAFASAQALGAVACVSCTLLLGHFHDVSHTVPLISEAVTRPPESIIGVVLGVLGASQGARFLTQLRAAYSQTPQFIGIDKYRSLQRSSVFSNYLLYIILQPYAVDAAMACGSAALAGFALQAVVPLSVSPTLHGLGAKAAFFLSVPFFAFMALTARLVGEATAQPLLVRAAEWRLRLTALMAGVMVAFPALVMLLLRPAPGETWWSPRSPAQWRAYAEAMGDTRPALEWTAYAALLALVATLSADLAALPAGSALPGGASLGALAARAARRSVVAAACAVAGVTGCALVLAAALAGAEGPPAGDAPTVMRQQ
jgi:hypothetical protein